VNWLNAYIVSGLISAARHVSTIVDDNSRFMQRNAFMRDRRRSKRAFKLRFGSSEVRIKRRVDTESTNVAANEFFCSCYLSCETANSNLDVRMNNVRLSRATLSSNQKT